MRRTAPILIALVIISLILWLIFARGPETTFMANRAFARNIREPYQISNQEFYFFSGSAFGKYNLASNSSANLTPFYRLPNISQIKWAKDGALFEANNYSAADQLYPILRANLLPTDTSHWWVVDFESDQIKLVTNQKGLSLGAVWLKDTSDYIFITELIASEDSPAQKFAISRARADGSIKQLAEVESINKLLWADGQKIYFTKAFGGRTQLIEYNYLNNQISVAIERLLGAPVIDPEGTHVLYIEDVQKEQPEGGAPQGPLFLKSLAEKTEKNISKAFAGELVWSNFDRGWAAYSGIPEANNFSGNLTQWSEYKLAFGDKEDPQPLRLAAIDGQNLLFLELTGNNAARQATPVLLEPQPNLPDIDKLQEPVYEAGFQIIFNQDEDTYWVYILSGPYKMVQQKVINYIQALGIDPLQLNLVWLPPE